ncbi:hypothetical protein KIPB_015660, partial [Kipferlia bialata]
VTSLIDSWEDIKTRMLASIDSPEQFEEIRTFTESVAEREVALQKTQANIDQHTQILTTFGSSLSDDVFELSVKARGMPKQVMGRIAEAQYPLHIDTY